MTMLPAPLTNYKQMLNIIDDENEYNQQILDRFSCNVYHSIVLFVDDVV